MFGTTISKTVSFYTGILYTLFRDNLRCLLIKNIPTQLAPLLCFTAGVTRYISVIFFFSNVTSNVISLRTLVPSCE